MRKISRSPGSFEAKDVSDYYRSPVEPAWIKNINFDHDFIGSYALEAEVAHPKRVCSETENKNLGSG